MRSPNTFEQIDRLLKANLREEALSRVYDSKSSTIKAPYLFDQNHAWYIVGDLMFRDGNYDGAIEAFTNSIEFRNDDTQAILALANSYSEASKYSFAEETLRKGHSIDPNDEAISYNLGNALFDQSKYEEAVKFYSSITEKDEELYGFARKNISTALNRLGGNAT